MSLGIGTVRLNVQLTDQSIMPINLRNVYYVPSLIANPVSGSSLFKKGFNFPGGKCTLNRISDDQEVAYAPMVNGLFALQVVHTSLIALSSRDSAFTWHRRLGHIGLDSLKKALGGRSLDPNEVALIKSCKACAEAKQQRHPSYTPQQVPEDILDVIHTDVVGPITPTGFNGCRYYLVLIDGYSRVRWVETMKEKSEAFSRTKKFIIFIQTQTGKRVKRLRLDNGLEYGGTGLLEWLEEQGIHHEPTVPYSPEMNGISERSNGVINTKARALIADAGVNENLWPEAVKTSAYLANRTKTSTHNSVPLEVFLRAYHGDNDDYTQDLKHLKIFGCKARVHIPEEKRAKSRKYMGKMREGILVGYEDVNIFRIYFPLEKKIERIQDVTFVEEHQDDTPPHASANTLLPEESLSPVIPDESILPTSSANSNHHISSLPTYEPSPAISSTSSTLSEPLDETLLEEIEQPRRSQRERRAPNRYEGMAVNMAISAVISKELQEPLTYEQALASLETELWKQAMNEEVQALEENHTWQIVDSPSNAKVLGGKWVYRIKRGVDGEPSRYKARWIAKGYEQIYGIDFEETYAAVVKSATYRILFALIAHFSWHAVLMDAATAFLNSGIDVTVYMQLPTGYYGDPNKIALLLKTLYGLKQSARQWASLLGIALKEAGLKPLYLDFSVYIRNPGTAKMVIVAIYVNDILVTGPDMEEINALKRWLLDRFRMKDLGPCRHYLGMKIDRDLEAKTLIISQLVYAQKALESIGMQDCKSAATPMAENPNLVANFETAEP